MGWRFWIDRGGTFTDVVAIDPAGGLHVRKPLSREPGRAGDAALRAIRDLLGLEEGAPIPAGLIEGVKMGTTVATNALLERAGAAVLLVVNRGFEDLLRIGNQARPRLFDLDVRLPPPLAARVGAVGARTGADGRECAPLDEAEATAIFAEARAEGIGSCAIALVHAWRFPAHELRLGELARAAGFTQVSLSHQTSALPRLVPRADTTVADAYLSPVLDAHVARVTAELPGVSLHFMQSHGGLARAGAFRGKDAVLSGPAGGIVGAVRTAARAGYDRLISFDMGGTSTDVALYDGAFARVSETEIAGVRLAAPMMAIHTVAAGGGSILHFDGARLRVGPDSAGADPGPACYRRGGPLTVTDANLMLGRIVAGQFPALFGPHGNEPLDAAVVAQKFAALAGELAAAGMARSPAEIAAGFVDIAVANMAHAIKQVSLRRGIDPAGFALVSFGGAGGQHACAVADALGMRRVLLHPLAGVLSAYGIGLAAASVLRERAVERPLAPAEMAEITAVAELCRAEAEAALAAQGVAREEIGSVLTAALCYAGTESTLPVGFATAAEMAARFAEAHRARFGFVSPGREIRVASVAAEARAEGALVGEPAVAERGQGAPVAIDQVRGADGAAMAVFARGALLAGDSILGPALITEAHATNFIAPGWRGRMLAEGTLVLEREGGPARAVRAGADERPDPVRLELFNALFASVAAEAGEVLRKTAQSVNIRERLDFSCALFDGQGRLVANAPHVPVHLGAMGESVRHVLARRGGGLRPGDVIALNDPYRGGTHLPDITVITPVFDETGRALRFFLAARGHHADIGGTTPGSTPPDSRTLAEEGVVIDDFLLVSGGEFREAALREVLAGAAWPARNPAMNIADLRAAIAANETGVRELAKAVAAHGWAQVARYMDFVRENAEASVRRAIGRLQDGSFDYAMDDGRPLRVAVRIERTERRAVIDFSGTGPAGADNFNAPPAVTRAAILYVFRCLIAEDIPLNEGCLAPIEIRIPPGSFLSPPAGHAVVAGNTEVSQAVCCALLGALGACASAQASMNNLLFGNAEVQYYETIAGGMGAGPGFDGASAVQTHMTNTRMTDPETIETRFPVRVERFAVRAGSGGAGRWRGGDGVIRRLRFLAPMTAVVVASRRRVAPFGLAGGAPGRVGAQWIERADGRVEPLAGAARAELAAGDALVVATPGGGGYGAA